MAPFILRVLLLTSLATFCVTTAVRASISEQSAPPKFLDRRVSLTGKRLPMSEYLATLSKQARINIFIDDEPFVRQADISVEASVREALDGVAEAFGYYWEVSKAGAILMRKHFRDPDDHPQFNLPELLKTSQDMTAALESIPYEVGLESMWIWKMRNLFQLLSPLQRSALLAGHTLQATDLGPEQLRLLEKIILQVAFGPLRVAWTSLQEQLEAMPSSYLERGGLPYASHQSLVYVYRGKDGTLRRVNLFREPDWRQPVKGAKK